jgi:GNAT superfamily N-acetyltransferase
MTDKQYSDAIIRGHFMYWDMLGTLRGIEAHKGNLCWLSGDIKYNYSVKLDGPDYSKEAGEIVKQMRDRQIPDNLTITPDTAVPDVDALSLFLSDDSFSMETSYCGMAKELHSNTAIKIPPKNINLFRVNEIYQLKISGAILNAAFEYDLFSFEHYLDVFNHPCVNFYLAEYKGIPACACMSIITNDIVTIGWVGRLKGFRKKGIAGYLVSMAERDAADKGKSVSVLSASADAVNAYSRIGYKPYCEIHVIKYKKE